MSRQELVLEADIAAAPDAVWKIVSDPKHFTDWMGNVKSVKRHDAGALKNGSKLQITTQLGSHLLVSEVEVSSVEPGKALVMAHLSETLDGHPFGMVREGRTELHLSKRKDGTHVEAKLSFVPHGLKAKLGAGLFLHAKLKPQMAHSLENLRALAEKKK